MLVLSRKLGETIKIGDNISVTVNKVSGNRVVLGIEAPGSVRVMRGELVEFRDGFEFRADEDTVIERHETVERRELCVR